VREWIRNASDRTEFVLVTAVCFSYFCVTSFYTLLARTRVIDLTTGRVLRGLAVELLLLGFLAAVLHVRGRWDLNRLGLRFSWKGAAAGVPLFILYLLLYWVSATVVIMIWPAARGTWMFRFTTSAPLALMIALLIVNSLFEEIAVTAYVVNALSGRGAALAITVSALIRFAYHLYQGPVAAISVLPLGFVFAGLFWRWRNIWPQIVAHTIANVVAFLLG
jgi:uncharacterized protein